MTISPEDYEVLRPLTEEYARVAALPIHQQKTADWTALNDLKPTRPLVFINEICWNEMNVNDELTLRCHHNVTRKIEDDLRKKLYCWRHLPGDMVFDPILYAPLVLNDTGYGIQAQEQTISQNQGDISSHHYDPVIKEPEDIAKIQDPVVTLNREESEKLRAVYDRIAENLIPVATSGIPTIWFSPWDQLVMWWGVEAALMDIMLRPEMVKLAMTRLTDAKLAQLRQYRELHALSYLDGNYRVGSGGLGCSSELKAKSLGHPNDVQPAQQWGCAVAQIFGSVSPEMHEEFGLEFEKRWTEQFGMVYYGCCEPLDRKVGILRKHMLNLRKISCSPWCNAERMAEEVGTDYVISLKPNPEIFARDEWHLSAAEAELRRSLEMLKGARVEVIAKDLSTMRGEPHRLWEWAEMAVRVCAEYA